MSDPKLQENIINALKTVQDPDLHKDIVSLGFVKNMELDGGKVKFDVELTTPACPVKEQLKSECETKVQAIEGVESVDVNMTAVVRSTQHSQPVLPGVKNFNVQIKEWNDEIIFLRKIVPGGTDKSYGIQVARLAGLPKIVLDRANEVLYNLEQREFDKIGVPKIFRSENNEHQNSFNQLGLFQEPDIPLIKKMKQINPNELSPREALEVLFELDQIFKEGLK